MKKIVLALVTAALAVAGILTINVSECDYQVSCFTKRIASNI